MRHRRNDPAEFRSIYSVRVDSIEALYRARHGDADEPTAMRDAAEQLTAAACKLAGQARRQYAHFAKLLGAIEMLVRWAAAVRAGESDSNRFLHAAQQRANDLENTEPSDTLLQLAVKIGTVASVNEIEDILDQALELTLILPFFGAAMERNTPANPSDEEKLESVVGVVSLRLDGRPLNGVATIQPGVAHDLELSVALNRWPEGATSLILDALSVEDAKMYELPRFVFTRVPEADSLEMQSAGRLRIDVPQTLRSRPMQFSYVAHFESTSGRIPLDVVGQRGFELRSHDPQLHPVTGYHQVDEKLLALRSEIRLYPGIPDSDIADFLLLMGILGGLAARGLQDAIFQGSWSEDKFQATVKQELRRHPKVAANLEEHPHAGGGISDLSFRLLRIELKVEPKKLVTVDDAAVYSSQTAQYVTASDRRLGIIALLDTSVKSQAPHSVANDIALEVIPPTGTGSHPILLGVVILRGNLATPSDLS